MRPSYSRLTKSERSTAVVVNLDFDKWADYLADGPLAMASLDRLVEGAIILTELL